MSSEASRRRRFLLLAATAILAYDLIAALVSRFTGVSYASFSVGSFLIYLAVGFLAQRRFDLRAAALAGALTGLVESTGGWATSWLIGPGRSGVGQPTLLMIGATIVLITILGTVVALLGAGIGRATARKRPAGVVRSHDDASRRSQT